MPGPRSIQYRLTLLFFAITLTAFAGIYLYVVPQLETNLREQKLHELADAAQRRRDERRADPAPRRARRGAGGAVRRPGRVLRGARVVAPDQAPRAGGREGGGRRLLAVDPAGFRRRARPAGQGVQRHAEPARAARHGPQAVHRHGVARAAHTDLLAGRLRRAAPGRGARRGGAPAVPGP